MPPVPTPTAPGRGGPAAQRRRGGGRLLGSARAHGRLDKVGGGEDRDHLMPLAGARTRQRDQPVERLGGSAHPEIEHRQRPGCDRRLGPQAMPDGPLQGRRRGVPAVLLAALHRRDPGEHAAQMGGGVFWPVSRASWRPSVALACRRGVLAAPRLQRRHRRQHHGEPVDRTVGARTCGGAGEQGQRPGVVAEKHRRSGRLGRGRWGRRPARRRRRHDAVPALAAAVSPCRNWLSPTTSCAVTAEDPLRAASSASRWPASARPGRSPLIHAISPISASMLAASAGSSSAMQISAATQACIRGQRCAAGEFDASTQRVDACPQDRSRGQLARPGPAGLWLGRSCPPARRHGPRRADDPRVARPLSVSAAARS